MHFSDAVAFLNLNRVQFTRSSSVKGIRRKKESISNENYMRRDKQVSHLSIFLLSDAKFQEREREGERRIKKKTKIKH